MLVLPAALVWAEEGFAISPGRRSRPVPSEPAAEPTAGPAREWSIR